MFVGTHMPLSSAALAQSSDKVLHFAAYFGLAVLLAAWMSTRGRLTVVRIGWAFLIVIGYAIFDELTQSLVARHTDLQDGIADAIGAAVGFASMFVVLTVLGTRERN